MANVAARQDGVIGRGQLMAAGLSLRAIRARAANGRLHQVHPGVYAVGHRALSRRGELRAALMAAGDGAALSNLTAGDHWRLRPSRARVVHVTSPRAARRRRGVRAHRQPLPYDEVVMSEGLRFTTPSRTLLDLAATMSDRQAARALEQAEVLGLAQGALLQRLLDRYPTGRGTRRILRILERGLAPRFTRSELERLFLELLDANSLQRPPTNQIVEGFEVDCVWARERVIVELDGRGPHLTKAAFERDRARDRKLQAVGWAVVRITWRQLHNDPADVVGDLRALLNLRKRPYGSLS